MSATAHTQRATSAQKAMLLKRLERRGLIPRRLCASDRTGTSWRAIFRAAGTPEPQDVFSWPTVDDWVGSLTMAQAHNAIDLLLADEARR